jgi:hypothetical protein
MALETATYINGLVSTNPTSGDNMSQGDDHIRLLKSTLLATFPNVTGAMTATHSELNLVCDSAAESTFTPTLKFGGASTGITYSTQLGRYARFGKRIFFHIRIVLSSKGSATGGASVSGLPSAAAGGLGVQLVQFAATADFTGITSPLAATINNLASDIDLRQLGSTGLSALTDAYFTNASAFNVAGFYETS